MASAKTPGGKASDETDHRQRAENAKPERPGMEETREAAWRAGAEVPCTLRRNIGLPSLATFKRAMFMSSHGGRNQISSRGLVKEAVGTAGHF